MDAIEQKHVRLDAMAARLERNQRIHIAYTAVVLVLGAALGFAFAHWWIDPVTVFIPCESGIEV